MHESVKIEDVLHKLTQPPTDLRLIDLVNEERIEISVLAHLLHKFVRVKQPEQFQFCFVGKGKSKSLVVLLSQSHPEDSLVIKCGGGKLIGEELQKFERSPAEGDQALANGIEDCFRPPLCNHHEYSGHSAIAFQFPSGCKSVQTLREAIKDEHAKKDELINSFRTFSSAFARWQKLLPSAKSFLGSFPWRDRDRERISQILAAYKEQQRDRVVEPLNSVLDGSCIFWRDKLQKIQCAGGLSHGDLNAHNLLIGRDQNGSLNWYVIDFFAASKDQHSPATDWAKLERDIKLRALRDICGNNAKFRHSLMIVDSQLETFAAPPTKKHSIGKCFALVGEVRKHYSRFFETDRSDIPEIEYLYYLLCWTLSYCGTDEFEELGRTGDVKTQDAIIESALHIFGILDKKIRHFGSPSQPVLVPNISPHLALLQKQAFFLLSIPTMLFIALLFGMHYVRPVATDRQALPVRILIAKFDAAPGTTQVNVSGGIASKLSEASPDAELEIHQSDDVIRLGTDSYESIQHLGSQYNADAVIWGSYEKAVDADEASVDIHFTPVSESAAGIRLSKTNSFLPFSTRDFLGFTAKEKLGSRMTVLAMIVLGWSRAGKGDSVGAIEAYSKAAEQQSTPDDMIDPGLVYQYRARERSQVLQFKEAIDDLTLAIKKGHDPDYVSESIGLRAIYWVQLRKRNETYKDCSLLSHLSNPSSNAFNYCGVAYMFLGNSRSSAVFFRKAIETSRYTGVKGHLYLSNLYAQLCDYEQSRKEHDEAVRIDPNSPELQREQQFFEKTHQTTSQHPAKPGYKLGHDTSFAQGTNNFAKEAVTKYLQPQSIPEDGVDGAAMLPGPTDLRQALANLEHLPARPSSSVVYVMKSRLLFALKRTKEAEDAADAAIAVDPTDAAAYSVRAQLFLAENNIESAKKYLQKATDLEPSFPEAYRVLADIALIQNQFAEAIVDYDKAIKIVSNVNDNFYLQDLLLRACPEQESKYRTTIEAIYRARQAYTSARAGWFADATKYLDHSKRLDPTNPYIFYLGSQIFEGMHKSSVAVKEITHAIELDPTIPDNYMQLGDITLRSQGWRAARDSYVKALKSAPVYLGYVKARCEVLNQDQAFECFSDLIAHFPQNRDLYLLRGTRQPNVDGKMADYTSALNLKEDADTLLLRGMLFVAKHDWQKAYADFNRSVELAPKRWAPLWARSLVKRELGDVKGAEEDLTLVMDLEAQEIPFNRSLAFVAIAQISVRSGKLDEALNNLNTAIKYNNSYALAYELKGDIFIQQHEIGKAIDCYRQSLSRLPKSYSWDPLSLTMPEALKKKSLNEKLKRALAMRLQPLGSSAAKK